VADNGFLRVVYGFERQLAKMLAIILAAVIVVASLQLVLFLGGDLLDLRVNWTGEGLIGLLDQILVILIALEVLQNLTAYLREHTIQIELVLVTALTAVARPEAIGASAADVATDAPSALPPRVAGRFFTPCRGPECA
jgi:uncharacterized membrane protein (DUF373 family)